MSADSSRDAPALLAEVAGLDAMLGRGDAASLARFLARLAELMGTDGATLNEADGDVCRVLACAPTTAAQRPGSEQPLSDTFCSIVLAAERAIVIDDIAASPYREHPASSKSDFVCYMGTSLRVPGGDHGTLSVACLAPRATPFCDDELSFLCAAAVLVERALAHRDAARSLVTANALLGRSRDELDEFTYLASHDMQEPLRAITGFGARLAESFGDALDEKGVQQLGFVIAGGEKLQTLLSALLSYRRVGEQEDGAGTVDLDEVIRDARAGLEQAYREAGAVIECEPLGAARGVSGALVEAVGQLLNNALRFRDPARSLVVTIDRVDVGDSVVLRVTDNGLGIEPDFRDKSFGAFRKLHTKGRTPGIGLGLAIVAKVAALHAGRAWFEDGVDGGLRACLQLAAQ